MLQSLPEHAVFRVLGSLRLSLWLLALQLLLFLAGAIQMPTMEVYGGMNAMPLMKWMGSAPLSASWWLWASMGVMALLALNTVFCATASLIKKGQGRGWLPAMPPQVIHMGFLLMLAGHLISASGAMHISQPMGEGAAVRLPSGDVMVLRKVDMDISPRGYPLDWSATVEFYTPSGSPAGRGISAPNRPFFHKGDGIYIKQAAYGGALMEVHREPGTPWALSGGALFTLGTLALMGLKVQRER